MKPQRRLPFEAKMSMYSQLKGKMATREPTVSASIVNMAFDFGSTGTTGGGFDFESTPAATPSNTNNVFGAPTPAADPFSFGASAPAAVTTTIKCEGVAFESDQYPGSQPCSALLARHLRKNQRILCIECRELFAKYRMRRNARTKRDQGPLPPSAAKRITIQSVVTSPTARHGRLVYPIDTITDTLHKLSDTQQRAFLDFVQTQPVISNVTPGDDMHAEVITPIYSPVSPFLYAIAQETCPVYLKPFLQKKAFRLFINHIHTGTRPHFDGYSRQSKGFVGNLLTVSVHVSNKDDPHPVRLFIPVFKDTVEVPSGYSYVMPGSFLQHSTQYEHTEGVNRYSIVCFFKLKQTINGVDVCKLITKYYQ